METCHYCNRGFSSKIALNRHKLGSCMWMHTSKKDKQDQVESYEPELTDSQRDAFIRKLLLQVTKMNIEMTEMKKELSYLKRKQRLQITAELNKQQQKPYLEIYKWIKQFTISQVHLELVFRLSLWDGIKQVFMDSFHVSNTLGTNIPMRAFNEKPKSLFVYIETEETTKWVLCDNTIFRKMCVHIASRFIEMFVLWQTENADYLVSTMDTQDQDMHFMQKVMDNTYAHPTQLTKLSELLYKSLCVDFNLCEIE